MHSEVRSVVRVKKFGRHATNALNQSWTAGPPRKVPWLAWLQGLFGLTLNINIVILRR